jgi:ATP-binding cassette, subfamily B, multidrug efflux pump
MSDFREEEALGKAYDSQLLKRLMTYLRPYKWTVAVAVFLTLLVGPLTP